MLHVVDDQQHRVPGLGPVHEEFPGDAPQLAGLSGYVVEAELAQEGAVEFRLVVARLIDRCEVGIIVQAGNVAIQKRGLAGAVGAPQYDEMIGVVRGTVEVRDQQRILFDVVNLGRFGEPGKRRPQQPEVVEIVQLRSRVLLRTCHASIPVLSLLLRGRPVVARPFAALLRHSPLGRMHLF